LFFWPIGGVLSVHVNSQAAEDCGDYFFDFTRALQDEIIARTEHEAITPALQHRV
jgi:hypothetical protein